MDFDKSLSVQFHEDGNGTVYVTFIESDEKLGSHTAGIIGLSMDGWANLKDRLLAYHPNGFLRAESI